MSSTADREDAHLGKLEEESDDEPDAEPAAVESAVVAGGGPAGQMPAEGDDSVANSGQS